MAEKTTALYKSGGSETRVIKKCAHGHDVVVRRHLHGCHAFYTQCLGCCKSGPMAYDIYDATKAASAAASAWCAGDECQPDASIKETIYEGGVRSSFDVTGTLDEWETRLGRKDPK